MKRFPVIKPRYLPVRFPVFQTTVLWLLLDRLKLHVALAAVIWTLWALWWAVIICAWVSTDHLSPADFEKEEK